MEWCHSRRRNRSWICPPGPPDEELFMFMIGVQIEIGNTGIIYTERNVNLVVKALL